MPTLAIRRLSPRDLPTMRHLRARCEQLAMPGGGGEETWYGPVANLRSFMPSDLGHEKVYVALIDGELCAQVTVRPQEHRYRWDVLSASAGSPRLDATDDTCIELWTALLEYAIRQAGESGAKRLFAASPSEGPGYRSLRLAGFDPYASFFVLRHDGRLPAVDAPEGMRRQEDSDVWSIHQLYSHTTPRPVQFAEALTSAVWELPFHPVWSRIPVRRQQTWAYVVETTHGLVAYCRVEQQHRGVIVRLLVEDDSRDIAGALAIAAVARSGVEARQTVRVLVPGYARELIACIEDAGFAIEDERLAMVRHTTVPAIVHVRPAPVSILDARERIPKGVPSYSRRPDVIPSG